MARMKDRDYKRTRRASGQMFYLPRRIGYGLVALADNTVYRTQGNGWRKAGTLQTRTGKVV